MRVLVVYESIYGNTRQVATSVAAGLEAAHEVTLVPVTRATPALVAAADLLVVGGPTHIHGMSSATSRRQAAEAADKRDDLPRLDPDSDGPGVRGWLDALPGDAVGDGAAPALGAAFDTRMTGPAALTGRAGRGIARLLKRHGYRLLAQPESFLVSKQTALLAGEADRARSWGMMLGEQARAAVAPAS